MTKTYEAPKLTTHGTVAQLTAAQNKVGANSDQFSPTTPLVGSLVPAP